MKNNCNTSAENSSLMNQENEHKMSKLHIVMMSMIILMFIGSVFIVIDVMVTSNSVTSKVYVNLNPSPCFFETNKRLNSSDATGPFQTFLATMEDMKQLSECFYSASIGVLINIYMLPSLLMHWVFDSSQIFYFFYYMYNLGLGLFILGWVYWIVRSYSSKDNTSINPYERKLEEGFVIKVKEEGTKCFSELVFKSNEITFEELKSKILQVFEKEEKELVLIKTKDKKVEDDRDLLNLDHQQEFIVEFDVIFN